MKIEHIKSEWLRWNSLIISKLRSGDLRELMLKVTSSRKLGEVAAASPMMVEEEAAEVVR